MHLPNLMMMITLHICSAHDATNSFMVFTAYKHVSQKIHPVSTQFPEDCQVIHQIPEDPLLTLLPLPACPPDFTPSAKITPE